MPISPDISRKILGLKEECGLTFKQIGEEVGSSEANVRRYVMGETKVPDKQLLYSIIRVLGGDPEEVLGKKKPDAQPTQAPATQNQPYDHALYIRQEERHKEVLSQWAERHREEIVNLKSAYDSSLRTKDVWIERLKAAMDKAEEDMEKLETELAEVKKDRRHHRIAIMILAAVVILLILAYLVPDLLRGDWGHITYFAGI